MIRSIYIFIILNALLVNSFAQEFQIYNGDTINQLDESKRKQGMWITFGKTEESGEYEADQIVEKGSYKGSRKTDLWVKYYPNGKIKTEINYVNGRPRGEYIIYYENGQTEEQGNWKNNRNAGEFKRWHENGNVSQEFNFNATGKRTGTQKYFYENGQLAIVGDWDEGKESGELKEYYSNGDIKSVKMFNGGMIDVALSKTFEPEKPLVEVKPIEYIGEKKSEEVKKTEQTNTAVNPFDGNGFHTLYNKNQQISQKGDFRTRRLKDGLKYIYDDNGILINIEKYKNYKYVGDVPIEQNPEDIEEK